jgi:hypothetical protein
VDTCNRHGIAQPGCLETHYWPSLPLPRPTLEVISPADAPLPYPGARETRRRLAASSRRRDPRLAVSLHRQALPPDLGTSGQYSPDCQPSGPWAPFAQPPSSCRRVVHCPRSSPSPTTTRTTSRSPDRTYSFPWPLRPWTTRLLPSTESSVAPQIRPTAIAGTGFLSAACLCRGLRGPKADHLEPQERRNLSRQD